MSEPKTIDLSRSDYQHSGERLRTVVFMRPWQRIGADGAVARRVGGGRCRGRDGVVSGDRRRSYGSRSLSRSGRRCKSSRFDKSSRRETHGQVVHDVDVGRRLLQLRVEEPLEPLVEPDAVVVQETKKTMTPSGHPVISLYSPELKSKSEPPALKKIPFIDLSPNGTGASASERVPASSGPPVPTSLPFSPELAKIAFQPSPEKTKTAEAAPTEETPAVESLPVEVENSTVELLVTPPPETLEPWAA